MGNYAISRKKIALWAYFGLVLQFLLIGCKASQPTIIEKDKLVYITKDSTIYKDSIIYVPFESVKEITILYDTLVMETSLAKSKCYVDTVNNCLNGHIWNKSAIHQHYTSVDNVSTKDSLIYIEKPVPYKVIEKERYVPRLVWACIIWAAISILILGFVVYIKITQKHK